MTCNIVITMAGKGSRFYEAGYQVPKYEIEAHGHSLFDWSMLSLKNFLNLDPRVIFVCLAENNSNEYVLSRCKALGINDAHVVTVDSVTDGQATSAYVSRHLWKFGDSLLIYNIDTYINPSALKPNDIPSQSDGWIPCFKAGGSHWSFVKIGQDGWATAFAEKERISEMASVGLYWFASAQRYVEAYDRFFADSENLVRGERYIAPLYRDLLTEKGLVSIIDIKLTDVHVLGTPAELNNFLDLDPLSIRAGDVSKASE